MAHTLIDGYPVISQKDVEHMADQIRVERERVERLRQAFEYEDIIRAIMDGHAQRSFLKAVFLGEEL